MAKLPDPHELVIWFPADVTANVSPSQLERVQITWRKAKPRPQTPA